MSSNNSIPVMLYTEATPNPNTLKFVVNRSLIQGDTFQLSRDELSVDTPFANEIYTFPYVQNLFFSTNYISISKDDTVLWAEAMPELREAIKKYLDADNPVFSVGFVPPLSLASNSIADDDSDVNIRIKAALDKYVKPAVEMDGGNISFVKFDDGVLVLQLQGSCSGCPSSTITLKQGIEQLMKRFVPEVREVVAENE
jgi:Fe-S cluster biogenesis protein NfuA